MIPSYLTTSQAAELLAMMPALPNYAALPDDAAKLAALSIASMRVDAAHRWQGRKYDTSGAQVLEFPRVPYVPPLGVVWDWDANAEEAIVPGQIKLAVLYEADSIAQGNAARIAAAIAAGLTSQTTGSLSESYNTALAASGSSPLCPQAEQLVRRYRLTTGGIR